MANHLIPHINKTLDDGAADRSRQHSVTPERYYILLDTCSMIHLYRAFIQETLETLLDTCGEEIMYILPSEVLSEIVAMKNKKASDEKGFLIPPSILEQIYTLINTGSIAEYSPIQDHVKERIHAINNASRAGLDKNTRLGEGDCGLIGAAMELTSGLDPRSRVVIVSDDSDISILQKQMNPKNSYSGFHYLPSAEYIHILEDKLALSWR